MRPLKIANVKTYEDGRTDLEKLYESYERFDEDLWIREIIHSQKYKTKKKRKKHSLPILVFRTKMKGPALWLITGIHGEEPAGPIALSEHIGFLNDLARKIPLVVFPLCNPVGYSLDWRYPDTRRHKKGVLQRSVGSSEHYLPSLKNMKKPRHPKPLSEEAEDITNYTLRKIGQYPPVLVLDFHEDESSSSFYIYSQGRLGVRDPAAKEVVEILVRANFKVRMSGKTQFGEKISKGIASVVHDSSVDELLASRWVIIGKRLKRKKSAKSVIVIETNTRNVPLKSRVKVHTEILLSSERFYDLAKGNRNLF